MADPAATGRAGGTGSAAATDRAGEAGARSTAVVILNPTKVDDEDAFRESVDRALAVGGWREVRWCPTTADDPGQGMAREALGLGAGLVLACGGDGTVRAVLTVLAGSTAVLGVVPLGTGNLLARNLGLPLDDLDAAVDVAVTGPVRALDVGRVDPEGIADPEDPEDPEDREGTAQARAGPQRFAVMAGIGMDAAIMRDAPERAKARIGWPAYVVSLVRHLRGPGVSMRLELDGGAPRRLYARTVLVGNVGTLQAGLQVLPDARPDDGMLDVAVLAPRSPLDWVRIAGWMIRRRPRGDPRYVCYRGRLVRVTTRRPQPCQVDGDLLPSTRSLRIEVEPGALRVRVRPEPGGTGRCGGQGAGSPGSPG